MIPPLFLLSPRSPDCQTINRAREPSTSSPAPRPSRCLSPGDKPSHKSRKPASLSRARTLSFTAVGAHAHAAYSLSPSSKPPFYCPVPGSRGATPVSSRIESRARAPTLLRPAHSEPIPIPRRFPIT
jgi:hypothetical protein